MSIFLLFPKLIFFIFISCTLSFSCYKSWLFPLFEVSVSLPCLSLSIPFAYLCCCQTASHYLGYFLFVLCLCPTEGDVSFLTDILRIFFFLCIRETQHNRIFQLRCSPLCQWASQVQFHTVITLGTKYTCPVTFKPQPLYPAEKPAGINSIGSWVTPIAGVDVWANRKIS